MYIKVNEGSWISMRIDFAEKLKGRLSESKAETINTDMEHPEELSLKKAQAYANRFAQEELGDMENFLQLLELQARRSVLFANIDMEAVRKAIFNPVKAVYFDKQGRLKADYADLFIAEYTERIEQEKKYNSKGYLF